MSLLCTAPATLGVVAIFPPPLFKGIAKHDHAKALIGCAAIVIRPKDAIGIDAVVGWGLKDNTLGAVEFAHKHGLPYWRLEDGFLRSVDLGVHGDTALSMVLDDQSMYYDARRPSRLESLLQSDCAPLQDAALLARAQRAMDSIVASGLSKYNSSPVGALPLPAKKPGVRRILVVDQTAGDLSVSCGLGTRTAFDAMLSAALKENPNAEVFVKTHPDVVSGKRKGNFSAASISGRVRFIQESCNPIRLAQEMDRVYVVTSQLGFEALLAGTEVVCFGAPFYAGWGLTDDRVSVVRRTRKRTLTEVFLAAYMLYTRYVSPETGLACDIETVIDHLALQRKEFARNQGKIYCFGFRIWKQGYVRAYLRSPGNEVHFPKRAADAKRLGFDSDAKLLVWGQKAKEETAPLCEKFGTKTWRMEDGFLRSVGLGSDLATPASLVVDRQGIYYDPSQVSELETILQNEAFPPALVERATKLRKRLIDSGLSKYNVGDHLQPLQIDSKDKRVVLVPGQVEDDASIALGCKDIHTNLGLLQSARTACPEAFIVFKPHPDVLSGNRVGHVPEAQARQYCDHIEVDASLAQCLAVTEEVHVMSSLVGFEALLRGLEVHVYGQPFYSGWGLTIDRHPLKRRSRKLHLDELVAATYLLYPRYLNRKSFRFTTAEAVIDELEEARARGVSPLHVSWAERQLRKLRNIAKEVTRGS